MHVLIDARLYRRSTAGIGRYSRELITHLALLDQQTKYTLLFTPADDAECDLKAANFTRLVTDIPHFSVAEQTKLPKILADTRPDLVHFLNFNHPVFYHASPFITTIHDLTMNFFPVGRQKNPVRRLAYNYVMTHAATAADASIVPTKTVQEDVVSHLPVKADKVRVIYEGAPEVAGPIARPTKEDLAHLGIGKPYILFVSQWRPHKGLGILIEAFAEIRKKHNVQLVVTGKANPQFPEIPAAIEASPVRSDIVTPGFVDDEVLETLYAGTQLFIFPSWYEGFGLPPLEAMARNVPVASSNASVMPEILADAAAYFDPRNPSDVAKVISDLLANEDKRRRLVAKGKEQVKKYSWKKMAEETLALYREFCQ